MDNDAFVHSLLSVGKSTRKEYMYPASIQKKQKIKTAQFSSLWNNDLTVEASEQKGNCQYTMKTLLTGSCSQLENILKATL